MIQLLALGLYGLLSGCQNNTPSVYTQNLGQKSLTTMQDTTTYSGLEVATLGGGCFWCIEAVFDELKGVEKAVSGYTGGATENPTYREVCYGRKNYRRN